LTFDALTLATYDVAVVHEEAPSTLERRLAEIWEISARRNPDAALEDADGRRRLTPETLEWCKLHSII